MRLLSETVNNNHVYDKDKKYLGYYQVQIQEYLYDNEEERIEHVKEMEANGFKDSGTVKTDIGNDFWNPNYVWYAHFSKRINHPAKNDEK